MVMMPIGFPWRWLARCFLVGLLLVPATHAVAAMPLPAGPMQFSCVDGAGGVFASDNPATARPLGAVNVSGQLVLQLGFVAFAAPVDIYQVAQLPTGEQFILNSLKQWLPFPAHTVPYRPGSAQAVNSDTLWQAPLAGLPPGAYVAYTVVVPAGTDPITFSLASSRYYLWCTTRTFATAADPLYQDQWHLKNTGQPGATGVAGTPGEDMNVEPVWLAATPRMGNGIRIAVVDDGLEIAHEDLAANVAAGLSHDDVDGDTDPDSGTHAHGTSVAGIAAARDNSLGGRGAAPRANLVGYNLLQALTTANAADAMTRGSPNVHISNNSWGAPDGNGTLDFAPFVWRTAIASGLNTGRNGRGTIYSWAAGNGATVDNSNYDGYANNRGVIAVAAVNDRGVKSSYSESGANLWISAPGGEFCDTHTITTTDRTGSLGDNATGAAPDYANTNYTQCMNGTSAATPGAAGVIALMLEANPNLGWRDVRLILAQSARKNHAADAGWTTSTTAPAYNFNHKYGFGVINAQAAVNLASSWTNVGTELTHTTALASPGQAIPDNNATGVSHIINVTTSGITNIEFIEITFSAANHTYSGDLEITLTSPGGTVSRLAEPHFCACTPYSGWVFSSARHLGEAANGNWTLTVKDLYAADIGTFQSWRLKFYGR